jgi:hypothetical protein
MYAGIVGRCVGQVPEGKKGFFLRERKRGRVRGRASAVDTTAVMTVLEQEIIDSGKDPMPLWRARPGTAGRLRGRVEFILNWATARGHRSGTSAARSLLAMLAFSRPEDIE